MIKLLLAMVMVVGCGSDDDEKNSASESPKASLWSDTEMNQFLYECNNPEGGVDDKLFQIRFCSCNGDYFSKLYEFDYFSSNELEIIADHEGQIIECAKKSER